MDYVELNVSSEDMNLTNDEKYTFTCRKCNTPHILTCTYFIATEDEVKEKNKEFGGKVNNTTSLYSHLLSYKCQLQCVFPGSQIDGKQKKLHFTRKAKKNITNTVDNTVHLIGEGSDDMEVIEARIEARPEITTITTDTENNVGSNDHSFQSHSIDIPLYKFVCDLATIYRKASQTEILYLNEFLLNYFLIQIIIHILISSVMSRRN